MLYKRSCEASHVICDVIQEPDSILVISHESSERLMSHLYSNPVNPIVDILMYKSIGAASTSVNIQDGEFCNKI